MSTELKILICGMPRSMTTWAYNVVRELLAEPDIRNVWIAPGSREESLFSTAPGGALGKCHHFSRALAESADIVVYSYRDLRTAAVSCLRKFQQPCLREQIESWIEAEDAWRPFADIVLRYEDVERDPLSAAAALRAVLVRSGVEGLSPLPDADILARVERTFRDIKHSEGAEYDPSTLILPGHRTFQPPPGDLSEPEKALYERVQAEFGEWLAGHNYGGAGELGQETEYTIAAALLGALHAPVVVDVGVEHGSFVELALRSGGGQVIGFEPLPRHVEYLARRFGATPAVTIHPMALSNASGTAKLHIATDVAGRELDYHHTLSDLGDTATVIRTRQSLDVPVASLADLVRDGTVPRDIDFLKVDTDGHDLAVLEGLGELRPRAIMAEYWDTLPESSGTSLYGLTDLAAWAEACGYSTMVVVRRHGSIELIELGMAWTLPGDWGNVFFLRADFPLANVRAQLQALARGRYEALCGYVATLVRETEAKEVEIGALTRETEGKDAEIRRLDQGVDELRQAMRELQARASPLLESMPIVDEKAVRELADLRRSVAKTLEEKQAVINDLTRALHAYRIAFAVFRLVLVPLNFLLPRLRSGVRQAAGLLVPRLGILNQHEPRELRLPTDRPQPVAGGTVPRISVVTPSYNQAQFIERTIRSVLDQECPGLEYWVQDGDSRDGTDAILRRYEGRLAGWEARPDNGQSEAINRAFGHTTGEIMAWLNSDDVLFPGTLAYVGDYFARHPDIDVIYGHRILIDEDDRQIGRWMLPPHDDAVLSWADFVPQETLFWRRRIWEKAGGRVDESFRFAMDWDLLLRFREAGARFARVPRFLGGFRIHGRQKTSASISDVGFQEMDRLRKRVLGRVPSRVEVRNALLPYMVRHVAIDLRWKLRDGFGAAGARA